MVYRASPSSQTGRRKIHRRNPYPKESFHPKLASRELTHPRPTFFFFFAVLAMRKLAHSKVTKCERLTFEQATFRTAHRRRMESILILEPVANALVLGPVLLLAGHAAVTRALAADAHLEVVAHRLARRARVSDGKEILFHSIFCGLTR
jgi:hypothetical protein